MDRLDDSEILQRLQDDDESVLTIILNQVVPDVWPLLIRKFGATLSKEDLEEVVVSSLAKLWQSRESFDLSRGDLNGWFYVILRNSALDALRRRAPKLVEVLTVRPIGDAQGESGEEVEKVLERLIASLNEREQQVILPLFDPSGPSVSELSESLSVSPGAVRQLRFRAMKKLKESLASVGYTVHRSKKTLSSF